MIIVLIASNLLPTPPTADGWTRLGCACPDICGESGSGSGSGSGGGETVCKGVTIPATVTLTVAGIDETYDPFPGPDDGSTQLTWDAIAAQGTFAQPPLRNISYTLQRFEPVSSSFCYAPDSCMYCYRLGTLSQDDIMTLHGLAAGPAPSSTPQYVEIGTASDGTDNWTAYLAVHICINFDPDSADYLMYCRRINAIYVNTSVGYAVGAATGCSFNIQSGTWGGGLCGGLGIIDWTNLQSEQPCDYTTFCWPTGPFVGTPPTLSDTLTDPITGATFTWSTP